MKPYYSIWKRYLIYCICSYEAIKMKQYIVQFIINILFCLCDILRSKK
jgi:hypothetical protein